MSTVFSPAWGKTTSVTNATSATAAIVLPPECDELVMSNTSATAIVNIMCTPYNDVSVAPAGVAPTTSTGMVILPQSQIRVHIGKGPKVIRTIASAADGAVIVTPGRGV